MPSVIDLINLLEANKHPVPIAASKNGPLRPLYSVPFKALETSTDCPAKIKALISAISTGKGIIDKSANKTDRNDETIGAMRQIHSNQKPSWLPFYDIRNANSLSGRAKLFDSYARTNKKQTADNGGGNTTTGYIEFTASDDSTFNPSPPRRARIVYNYAKGLLYLSPQHYHSWAINGDQITLISGNDSALKNDSPNAFYWITDITSMQGNPVELL